MYTFIVLNLPCPCKVIILQWLMMMWLCMMEDGYLWFVDAMLMIKSIRNTREGLCPFVLFNCSQRTTYLLFLTVGGK